jgi:CRISPR-associated protein Csm3
MAGIHLKHNVFIGFEIEVLTGLHIGGTNASIEIGGVDNAIIRNPFTDEPYIPGSSLRGKMRSLLEKALNLPLNQSIGHQVTIHTAKNEEEYGRSPVAQIFGVTGDNEFARPARLIVRDIPLSDKTRVESRGRRLDLPYSEIKTEVAIDRVTSAATPRKLERVPAGAIFAPGSMVFSVYDDDLDKRNELFDVVIQGMRLLEDSYLGGSGSRGSGQVRFANLVFRARATENYGAETELGTAHSLLDVPPKLDLKQMLTSTDGETRTN